MNKIKFTIIICFALMSAQIAAGQISDSYYPFKVVSAEEILSGGETAVFKAEFPPEAVLDTYAFGWSVSAGTIIEGQGTPRIKVEIPGDVDSVTVSVTIGGPQIWEGSQTESSLTVLVIPKPQAVLIDELCAGYSCEHGFAVLDGFFTDLINNPGDRGYIIFYGGERSALRRQRQFSRQINYRRFDESRITLLLAGGKRRGKTEFWRVPLGANPPSPTDEGAEENDELPAYDPVDNTKPFIFNSESLNDVAGCSEYDIGDYAAFLIEDAKRRGNIVIRETTRTSFWRKEKEILSELDRFGIVRTRLKTFYIKVRPNDFEEGVELWIIPPRR